MRWSWSMDTEELRIHPRRPGARPARRHGGRWVAGHPLLRRAPTAGRLRRASFAMRSSSSPSPSGMTCPDPSWAWRTRFASSPNWRASPDYPDLRQPQRAVCRLTYGCRSQSVRITRRGRNRRPSRTIQITGGVPLRKRLRNSSDERVTGRAQRR